MPHFDAVGCGQTGEGEEDHDRGRLAGHDEAPLVPAVRECPAYKTQDDPWRCLKQVDDAEREGEPVRSKASHPKVKTIIC